MSTDAMLTTTGQILIGFAEKRRRAKASMTHEFSMGLVTRMMKVLLHLCGFGAFVWSMFLVHSVAGGLAIMVSCFLFSSLIGGSSKSDPSTNNVR